MRTRTITSVWVMILLLSATKVSSQFQYQYVEDFGPPNEVLLAAPDPREGTQLLPTGTDLYEGNDVNTIYYGLTPPNSSNKPVLVFVHGYASSASVWYTGEDNMYNDVYQDGYRSAYVSLTPNRHMWTNGFMLANMVNVITQHYGVSSVKVVAWSKGGVDTDCAVVHWGANQKVSEVFTLSTPHNGTSIAEAANSFLLSIVNLIAMQNNDATKSLTRGYMSYYRSVTDNLSSNNTPFTTLGGWGNGPLARLDIPQTFIHAIDGGRANGGNDGVVPYQSSRRPGGRELFDGQRKAYYGWDFAKLFPYYPGDARTDLDHFEVTRGIVWPYVRDVFNGSLKMAAPTTPANYNPNRTTTSQMQLVASEGGADHFYLSSEDVQICILNENLVAFTVVDAQGQVVEMESIDGEGAGQWFQLNNVQNGTYHIESEEAVAAMVVENDGPAVALEMMYGENGCLFESHDDISMRVLTSALNLDNPVVTGTMHRLHDLEFNSVNDAPVPVRFNQEGDAFVGSVGSAMAPGVYSVTVSFRSGDFARTLTATFTKLGQEPGTEVVPTPSIAVNTYPNPFQDGLNITADLAGQQAGTVRIYDIFGKELRQFDLNNDTPEIRWEARREGFAPGLYIIELEAADGNTSTAKAIMK